MRKQWILCVALCLWGSNSALAINTYKNWDGQQHVSSFGCPDTTTYGQFIKTSGGQRTLGKFSFWWGSTSTGSGSMVVRGEVYAWANGRATGNALYESKPRRISFHDIVFHKITFDTGGITVAPRAKYVLFASIAKDYDQCLDNYTLSWGAMGNVYHGGKYVYQNNGGRFGDWTTQPWNIRFFEDLAFKASKNP